MLFPFYLFQLVKRSAEDWRELLVLVGFVQAAKLAVLLSAVE